MRAAQGLPPSLSEMTQLDHDLGFLLAYHSYASPRRAIIRTAISYSDSFPPPELVREIPRLTFRGESEWKKAVNLGAVVHTNDPVREAMRLIGGGAEKMALEAEKSIRLAGGRGNLARILLSYGRVNYQQIDPTFHFSEAWIAEELFHSKELGRVKVMRAWEVASQYKMMTDTSSGYFYKQHSRFPPKRLGYIHRHRQELAAIGLLLENRILGPQEQILLPWFMASRGKMNKIDEIMDKITANKPLSRGIMVGDPAEHYIFYAIYRPIFKRIMQLMGGRKGTRARIKIGIKKNSTDWPRLRADLKKWEYNLTTDWSSFDSRLRPELLRRAWQVIVCALQLDEEPAYNTATNLTNLYQNNFVEGVVTHAGFILAKKGGLPSGSIFTSIIGSVCNYIMLKELMEAHPHVREYEIFVYGDDAIIGFNSDSLLERKEIRRAFIHRLAKEAERRFGMELSKTKTELVSAETNYYQLVQPYFAESATRLRQGTRNLNPIAFRNADEFSFFTDYEEGLTHRAQYHTRDAAHFLGKSFDKWGRQIMTSYDTMVRMINPEETVATIGDAKSRVLEYTADNPHNRLLVNQMRYLYLALHIMEEQVGGAHARWPRSLSQKMRATEADLLAREEEHIIDKIRKMDDGSLRLEFRAVDHYVDLKKNEYYEKILKKFSEEMRKRTGWEDVLGEWDELKDYARDRRSHGKAVPSRTPRYSEREGRSGPWNERVRQIEIVERDADLRENYAMRASLLGGGSPDYINMVTEKVLDDSEGQDRIGFISGCLLNIWPRNSTYREQVINDLKELVEHAEGLGFYARGIENGLIVWEEGRMIRFLGAQSARNRNVQEVFLGRNCPCPLDPWGFRGRWTEGMKVEVRNRINSIINEWGRTNKKDNWVKKKKRMNYIFAYFEEINTIKNSIKDANLAEIFEKRFTEVGPESDWATRASEWRNFNDDHWNIERVGMAEELYYFHLVRAILLMKSHGETSAHRKKRKEEEGNDGGLGARGEKRVRIE